MERLGNVGEAKATGVCRSYKISLTVCRRRRGAGRQAERMERRRQADQRCEIWNKCRLCASAKKYTVATRGRADVDVAEFEDPNIEGTAQHMMHEVALEMDGCTHCQENPPVHLKKLAKQQVLGT